MEITVNTRVGDILYKYPHTEAVFIKQGFTELKNPVLRRTVAKYVTLQTACEKKGVDPQILINALEQAID